MKPSKQTELIDSYFSNLNDETKTLYREIITHLSGLGYSPRKVKSAISFMHGEHNKQIAKMGMRTSKKADPAPFFSLRFSACAGYSERFIKIVGGFIEKYPTRAAMCVKGGCGFYKGAADSHVYKYEFPGGEIKSHCGAYAIEIPDIKTDDLVELKKLINEEHEYLMKHEAVSTGEDSD